MFQVMSVSRSCGLTRTPTPAAFGGAGPAAPRTPRAPRAPSWRLGAMALAPGCRVLPEALHYFLPRAQQEGTRLVAARKRT